MLLSVGRRVAERCEGGCVCVLPATNSFLQKAAQKWRKYEYQCEFLDMPLIVFGCGVWLPVQRKLPDYLPDDLHIPEDQPLNDAEIMH